MGGILSVGRGAAAIPPRLISLDVRYESGGGRKPDDRRWSERASTFDSGGISIKPAANMDDDEGQTCPEGLR